MAQLGPVGVSASAPLLGRKQTSVASLKLGPIGACPFLTCPFYWQQKLNKLLFCKAFLHFSSAGKSAGHQDHTTSPSANCIATSNDALRPSHPALNTRDDREAPLCGHGTARRMSLIWGIGQCGRAAADWHDGQFAHDTHAGFARRTKTTCPGHINDL